MELRRAASQGTFHYTYAGKMEVIEDQDDLLELLEIFNLRKLRDLFTCIESQVPTVIQETYPNLHEVGKR